MDEESCGDMCRGKGEGGRGGLVDELKAHNDMCGRRGEGGGGGSMDEVAHDTCNREGGSVDEVSHDTCKGEGGGGMSMDDASTGTTRLGR